jgi:recombination protein RecT
MKTVLRNMLGMWGILSVEMQKAVTEDEKEPEIKDITEEANDSNIIDYPLEEVQVEKKETVLEQGEIVFE